MTDCSGEQSKTGAMPSLPVELVDKIIAQVIQDMRNTQDGSGVARLMHVSILMRYKVAREFPEIVLYEDVEKHRFTIDASDERLLLQLPVVSAVWQSARDYFRDASIRRHDNEIAATAAREPNMHISTKDSMLFRKVVCSVVVKATALPSSDVCAQREEQSNSCEIICYGDACVAVGNVRDVLRWTLQDEDMQAVPHLASPYHRAACLGSFVGTDADVSLEVKLAFTCHMENVDMKEVSWTFTNIANVDDP